MARDKRPRDTRLYSHSQLSKAKVDATHTFFPSTRSELTDRAFLHSQIQSNDVCTGRAVCKVNGRAGQSDEGITKKIRRDLDPLKS